MIIFRTQDALNASASRIWRNYIRSCYEESENLPIWRRRKIYFPQFRLINDTYLVILIIIYNPRDKRLASSIFHWFVIVLSH